MMYNPQLDTFICVVEAGSFSKAAEELYISAPAVIKQINSRVEGADIFLDYLSDQSKSMSVLYRTQIS